MYVHACARAFMRARVCFCLSLTSGPDGRQKHAEGCHEAPAQTASAPRARHHCSARPSGPRGRLHLCARTAVTGRPRVHALRGAL